MTPSWFMTGRGDRGTYASSPMRVTLAERKVCRTKTMGLGQECRSSAWGEMERGVSRPHIPLGALRIAGLGVPISQTQ